MRWLRLRSSVLALALAGCAQSEAVTPLAETDLKAPTPEDLIARAEQSQSLDEAAEHLVQALKIDPKHRQALRALAAVEHDMGVEVAARDPRRSVPLFLHAAGLMRTVRDTSKTLEPHERDLFAQLLFQEARARGIQGQPKVALASLTEAVENGFTSLEAIDSDPALASVRGLPEFPQLRKDLEVKAKTLALARAQALLAANRPFPFDFTLPDLRGKPVRLADAKGRVTIVDFWGTWCPPCLEEIPHFVALSRKYRDRGLAIVGLNYEDGDEAEARTTVQQFVRSHGIPYPCLIGDEKTQAQVPGFDGFPTTLFLDHAGTVRLKLVGAQSPLDLEAIVVTLLDETSAAANAKK